MIVTRPDILDATRLPELRGRRVGAPLVDGKQTARGQAAKVKHN